MINYQENVKRESDKKRCNTVEREGGQHQDHLLETLRTLITLKSAISFSSTLAVKKWCYLFLYFLFAQHSTQSIILWGSNLLENHHLLLSEHSVFQLVNVVNMQLFSALGNSFLKLTASRFQRILPALKICPSSNAAEVSFYI